MRSGEWHRSDRLVSCMPRDLLSSPSGETETERKTERKEEGRGAGDEADSVSRDKQGDEGGGEGQGQGRAEAGLQQALAMLRGAGMLQELGEQHGFEQAWGALGACLLADEVRQVHFSITKVRAKG
jgi:hypothetical protein